MNINKSEILRVVILIDENGANETEIAMLNVNIQREMLIKEVKIVDGQIKIVLEQEKKLEEEIKPTNRLPFNACCP